METEIWKDIKGFEGLYQVSNMGEMRALDKYVNAGIKNNKVVKKTGKKLLLQTTKRGYKHISICKNGKSKNINIHRIVMETFCPDKKDFKYMPYEKLEDIDLSKLEVNHKDENPSNNKLSNLEWCTHSYNINYGDRKRKVLEGIMKTKYNFTPVIQKDLNGNFICKYDSIKQASIATGLYRSQISRCARGIYKQSGGFIWEFR